MAYSCESFYKHILSQKHLLKEIRKNAKYEWQFRDDIVWCFLFDFLLYINCMYSVCGIYT
jgi:hypothetical protein